MSPLARVLAEREGTSSDRSRQRTLELIAIGTAAGLFSGVFGVGGGSVIVPLLVLWLGYHEREATGTSLAAIVFIAAFASAVQAAYGNLRLLDALAIGVPATGGVLIGAWLQQRLAGRSIMLLFAAVLVAAAVELLLE
ncbi:MAG: TSUP family transporter [Solirubrobacterales bacterium]